MLGKSVGTAVNEGAGVGLAVGAGVVGDNEGAGVVGEKVAKEGPFVAIAETLCTVTPPSCAKVPLCICDTTLVAALLGIVTFRTTLRRRVPD